MAVRLLKSGLFEKLNVTTIRAIGIEPRVDLHPKHIRIAIRNGLLQRPESVVQTPFGGGDMRSVIERRVFARACALVQFSLHLLKLVTTPRCRVYAAKLW